MGWWEVGLPTEAGTTGVGATTAYEEEVIKAETRGSTSSLSKCDTLSLKQTDVAQLIVLECRIINIQHFTD